MDFETTAKDSKLISFKNLDNDFERIIYHCPDCLNLPLIKINKDLMTVSCECSAKHSHVKTVEELYQQLNQESLSPSTLKGNKCVQCFGCKKYLEVKDEKEEFEKIIGHYAYCFQCQGCVCIECAKKPDLANGEIKHSGSGHKLIPIDKLVTHCPLHRNKYSSFCLDDGLNICMKCGKDHRQHKMYHFMENLLSDEEVYTKKKKINDLRNSCENLENKVNSILDKIRSVFHEQMKKQMNLILLDELLLDGYQTNQFNYYYLQNVLNNLVNLTEVEEAVTNQDPKKLIIDLVNNCNLMDLDSYNNENKNGELLKVSQAEQKTKLFKATEYNKDTFKLGENGTVNNEEIKLKVTQEQNQNSMKVSNKDIKSHKSTIKEEKEADEDLDDLLGSIGVTAKSKKNEESFKGSKSIKSKKNEESFKGSMKSQKKEETFKGSMSIKSKKNEESFKGKMSIKQTKPSCEFVGKTNASEKYTLNDLPCNIEISLEIKNTGENDLPEKCYLFDESNCQTLLITDSSIDTISSGSTSFKKFSFDTYIYSKGSYQLRLVVKDPAGNIISTNKYEYSLEVE